MTEMDTWRAFCHQKELQAAYMQTMVGVSWYSIYSVILYNYNIAKNVYYSNNLSQVSGGNGQRQWSSGKSISTTGIATSPEDIFWEVSRGTTFYTQKHDSW